jgi:hypothetical protein
MKSLKNTLVITMLALLGGGWAGRGMAAAPSEQSQQTTLSVRAPGITVGLSPEGTLVGINLADGRLARAVRGCTRLKDLYVQGEVAVKRLENGGVQFTRNLASDKSGRKCVLIDRFLPTNNSVRWEVEIRATGEPWTTTISTELQYPNAAASSFWTAWSDPDHKTGGWRDPLAFRPWPSTTWVYGGKPDELDPYKVCPVTGDYITMPLVTVVEPASDAALSLVLSPEDTLLDLSLSTSTEGAIRFDRTRYRLGGNRTVRFAMDLVGHAADWRDALGWMVNRYPQYFNPVNPVAEAVAGCGAYSGSEEHIDVAKLRRMAFRVNWKLSEDFPYMGMFLPPVADAQTRWERAPEEKTPGKQSWSSYQTLEDYARWMRLNGFYVFNYFNVTEYGRNMQFPPPPRRAKSDDDLWRDPHDYLFQSDRRTAVLMRNDKEPLRSNCYGALVVDPGDPAYQRHLLEQAQRHLDRVPSAVGIAIDRMDWLRLYNRRADDGVSWVDGKPARSLYQSWHGLLAKLGPLMHNAGKVIFVNNHVKRLDLLRHVDGIYCEFGQNGQALNATGLLSVRRPAIGWTDEEKTVRADPDAFFQRHLYMGVYPMAPYPSNNHSLNPSPWVDQQYLDYGPLLDAMRGKKWVLRPHCIEVRGAAAKANLFEVPGGHVIPVTFAGNARSVEVVLRGMDGFSDKTMIEALHPGVDKPISVAVRRDGTTVVLKTPLHRGCAVVRITHDGTLDKAK